MPRAKPLLRHTLYCVAALGVTASTAFAKDPWESVIGSRTDNPDGSSAITVGRRLPTDWETKVGADFNLAPPPSTDIRPGGLLPDTDELSSGAAWANVTVSSPDATLGWDKARIEGRIDPSSEQSKIGTTFSRSVPVNRTLSVTLEDGYAVTRTLGNEALPNGDAQDWETDKAVRLNVAPIDTTLSVSTRMTGEDRKWLDTVGAEKKLFGPVTVTGTVSETNTGTLNRSITAGFKRNW